MLASGQSPGAMESTREATNVPSFQSVVRLVNFLSGSLSCVNEKKPGRGEEEGKEKKGRKGEGRKRKVERRRGGWKEERER